MLEWTILNTNKVISKLMMFNINVEIISFESALIICSIVAGRKPQKYLARSNLDSLMAPEREKGENLGGFQERMVSRDESSSKGKV